VTAGSRRVRARFDEQAFSEDLARLSQPGREACSRACESFEREGVPVDRLRACATEHPAGTSLPGCLKVYVPGWEGRWRMVFQIAADESGALLSFLAAGVGHHRRGARAPNAYQVAHHRLHGRWPRRAS
jgi:hypothetical protein